EKANLAELQTRLQAEVQRLQQSVKADYEAANRTENLLNDSFTAQKGQMVKLQDNLTDFQILKRDAQTNEQLYQALLARVKEASIAGTMVPANVAVIDPGRLPPTWQSSIRGGCQTNLSSPKPGEIWAWPRF
ncbi:MAG: hypothetical protein NTW80_10050, partial [Deltaproteobacteria bacterium]|nr:hypothetical protein [Deltaproteobacteria bacterium]